MSEENRKSGTGFYVIAILILLIGVAYLTYMWSAKRAELAKCANENLILNSKINDLNGIFNGMDRIDSLDVTLNSASVKLLGNVYVSFFILNVSSTWISMEYCLYSDFRLSVIRNDILPIL